MSDEELDGESRSTGPAAPAEPRAAPPPPKRRRRSRRRSWRRLVRQPWFEPVATICVIVAVLGGLVGYTQNWPPLVVVESRSMQHGLNDTLGVINTGDLVLVQKVNVPSQVTTYVQGEGQSPPYSTYGEYGDVILYYKGGDTTSTPIIHRAILWLNYNQSANAFSAPSLAGYGCGNEQTGASYEILPTGAQPFYTCVSSSDPNAPIVGSDAELILWNVGWQSVQVDIQLNALVVNSPHSGFVTMGDDNCVGALSYCTAGGIGEYDQSGCAITCDLVEPAWVEGVARGMVPWFGAIKLFLTGDDQDVPAQSWWYLGGTILAILLIPTVVPRLVQHLRKKRSGHRDDGEDEESAEEPTRASEVEPTSVETGDRPEPLDDRVE